MSADVPAFPQVTGQRGLATYRQLHDAGWTEAQIRHRRTTAWATPYPHVVVPHRGQLKGEEVFVALALWAGPNAVLTGITALGYRGVQTPAPRTALFLVPATARSRAHGEARTVRTSRQVPVAHREGPLALASAARSLADAACYERLRSADLESLAITILQRGMSTVSELDEELWQRPQRKVAAVRAGLEAFVGGAWSRPEAALRRLWDAHPDLPQLITNPTLALQPADGSTSGTMLGRPDGYLPALGVVIQVHSRQFHQGVDDQGGDRWAATVEKDAGYVAAGLRVLGVTPWTLHSRPSRFLSRVRQLVILGPPSPMPRVSWAATPPPR